MSGAVQRNDTLEEAFNDAAIGELAPTGTDGIPVPHAMPAAHGPALRQVASERLAEHRRRRAEADAAQQTLEAEAAARQSHKRGGASKVRDAVAARYQKSVSYHEFLAQEAERALQQAHAEAEIAVRNAQAVADAQTRLLADLNEWKQSTPSSTEELQASHQTKARSDLAFAMADIVEAAAEALHLRPGIGLADSKATGGIPPTLTVRMYEELGSTAAPANAFRRNAAGLAASQFDSEPEATSLESSALDEEIAFRMAPEFDNAEDDLQADPISISGNVIEFPRKLVATRKARPRLAEGPLREESTPEPQLRIFEVEPEQISLAPAEPAGAPEWQSILLEGTQEPEPLLQIGTQLQYTMQPQTAPAAVRLMAITVDACCVTAGLAAFIAAAAQLAGPNLRTLPLPLAGATVAFALVALFLLYQMLFFTLAEATPGMRYARIGLCTFADANPTRKAMRFRILATCIAACPLGLGIAWAWMDEDGLGWHDRMSRMYQRGY